jgi:hypothetical protein
MSKEIISPVVIGGRQLLLIQEGTNGHSTYHLADCSEIDFLGREIAREVFPAGELPALGSDCPGAGEILQALAPFVKEAVRLRESARDRVRGAEVEP